jgi:heme exporter protein A
VLDFQEVQARGLVKLYGSTRALAMSEPHAALTFFSKQIAVVEGPNGSGKSTLLQLLALQARPTRGSLLFGDRDPTREPAMRGRIGLLAHSALLYPDLTGLENLELAAKLHGLSPELAGLRERFELGGFAERPVRTYSRGQLQRVSLARALVHQPRLLLLDEPSTGLDARGLERLVSVIREERDRGAIVVLVTHDTELAQTCADRRITLTAGRVSADTANAQTHAQTDAQTDAAKPASGAAEVPK